MTLYKCIELNIVFISTVTVLVKSCIQNSLQMYLVKCLKVFIMHYKHIQLNPVFMMHYKPIQLNPVFIMPYKPIQLNPVFIIGKLRKRLYFCRECVCLCLPIMWFLSILKMCGKRRGAGSVAVSPPTSNSLKLMWSVRQFYMFLLSRLSQHALLSGHTAFSPPHTREIE